MPSADSTYRALQEYAGEVVHARDDGDDDMPDSNELSLAKTVLDANLLVVSDYAMQHADCYGLRATTRKDGKVIEVELVLMDNDWEPIDEGGCNCDLDSPCNNPRCVMERGHF